MRGAGWPDHFFARTGELRLPAKHLISESPADDAGGFVLEVVHVHRRAGTRLRDTVGARTNAVGPLRDAREREQLALSVVDSVGIGPVHYSTA